MSAPVGTEDGILRVLPQSGEAPGQLAPETTGMSAQELRELHRLMVLARAVDREATTLQRQGELAVWAPLAGQEAAQVGSAFAMRPEDWIFPSYRELGPALVRGIDPVEYLGFYRAEWHGGMWDPVAHRFAMVAVPVASQILHAVGFGMGARLDDIPLATIAYFGDGATSEGDFHEGCNYAGVFGAPTVLFCQNNQWAISVPVARQTAAPIHSKAVAYGFPGVRVDGNDVLAVVRVVREAAERARGGGGPTLIEALTYRMAAHSTADDDTRYRPAEELAVWRERDPVERYRRWLTFHGIVDAPLLEELDAEAAALVSRIRAAVTTMEPRPVEELFSWVYAEMPEHLRRQRDEALGRPDGPAGDGRA